MATINKDTRGSWYLNYRDNEKQIRKFFGKGNIGRRRAELALSELTQKNNQQHFGIIEDISAELFFAKYLEYAQGNKALKSYKRDLTIVSHFLPIIQEKLLSQIKSREVEDYKICRLNVVSPATVNRELNTIKSAFNKAVEWGYLKDNPLRFVKRFKEPERDPRFFSHQESKKIIKAITDSQLKSIVLILLYTGMRRDELVHLEWSDVDLAQSILYIRPKPGWHPKSYKARTIPINNQLKDILIDLPHEGNRVFESKGEFIYYPSSLSRAFKRILRRLDIKDASLHTLRHTYASYLVMAGVDLATVQKLLGHSSIKTTMKYAHLAPDHLQEAAKKLDIFCCFFAANRI